ncbi:hypothetical protein GCM10022223_60130 [Kineosporia mesophila]|uniref:Uncharacterized protein n=2 Tax=Kineosporia mesophila TaxID=566012 RepID=A0ABP7AJJ8_9ACTN
MRLVGYLDDAAEADLILQEIAAGDGVADELLLGSVVLRRRVVELVDWSIGGQHPTGLPTLLASRCPGVQRPLADPTELDEHAHGTQTLVERAAGRIDDASVLLHRQAIFLAGPQAGLEPTSLLTPRSVKYLVGDHPWTPYWSDARTVSIARALAGDAEPLGDFLCHGLMGGVHELANLNYWAYYVGEERHPQISDTFQLRTDLAWRGSHLLAHLTRRIHVSHSLLPLNVHTAWSLLGFRRGLIHDDPRVARDLMERCEVLLGHDEIPAQVRIEATSMLYAIRSEMR